MIKFLTSALLNQFPEIRHGFFTRQGGASEGVFAGLNCGLGAGDDLGHVMKNYDEIAAVMGVPRDQITCMHQIHSAVVKEVTAPWPLTSPRPQGDGMITDQPNIPLGVLTADCMPLLLYEPKAKLIAAVHAGWGGAYQKIMAGIVQKMVARGAAIGAIHVALGPAIQQDSYEVDQKFYDRFVSDDAATAAFFKKGKAEGKWQFDLPGLLVKQIRDLGISQIDNLGVDTYPDPDSFYSFRRSTHRGEGDYGRQISLIMKTG